MPLLHAYFPHFVLQSKADILEMKLCMQAACHASGKSFILAVLRKRHCSNDL